MRSHAQPPSPSSQIASGIDRHGQTRCDAIYGWCLVAATIALFCLSCGVAYYSFGVYFEPIVRSYGWSPAHAAIAFAIMQSAAYATSPIWGALIHRLGIRGVLLGGTAVLALAFFGLSKLQSLSGLILGCGLAGVGIGAFLTVPLAAIGEWFEDRRSLATGIALSGFGLSAFMAPLVNLAIATYGWRMVFSVAAFAMILIAGPLCLLFPRRTPVAPAEAAPNAGPVDEVDFTAKEALSTPAFWRLAGLFLLSTVGVTAIYPFVVIYLEGIGFQRSLAVFSVSGLTACAGLGSILCGLFADRIDKKRIAIVAFVVQASAVALLAFVTEPWQLAVFVIAAGGSAGALMPLIPALVADYFGMRSFALILGMVYAPAMVFWLPIPSVVGWSAEYSGSFTPAWLALGALTFASIALAARLKPPVVARAMRL